MAPLKGEFPLSLWWHYSRLISFNDQKKKTTFKTFTFNINSLHQKCGHILFSTDYIYRWVTARKERQNLKGSH